MFYGISLCVEMIQTYVRDGEGEISLPVCSAGGSDCSTVSALILISVMINIADFPTGL